MSGSGSGEGPGPLDLIEEAVFLVRRAPPGLLAIYLAGTAPFVLAILFYWAYVTWFAPPPATVAWMDCGLVVLFIAMKVAHSEYCERLLALRLDREQPGWSPGRLLRIASVQTRIQVWGLVAIPLAAVATVPFGWAYAYYQSASVFGGSERAHELAAGQARLWPAQNHIALLVISALFAVVFVNLLSACLLIPWIANQLLGTNSLFGLSGWSPFNSTFLASVTALSWFIIDPLVKGFYTLRVFYGQARSTGEDLRVELRGPLRRGLASRVLWTAVIALALAHASPPARAAEAPAPAPAVDPARLDESIDRVLAGSDFQWRMRQPPPPSNPQEDGPVKSFVRRGLEMLSGLGEAARRAWDRLIEWLDGLFPKHKDAKEAEEPGMAASTLRLMLYGFILAALLLIATIAYFIFRNAAVRRRVTVKAREVQPAIPSVADEASHAGLLSAEGWLELARRHAALGEWRLVLRALYLATLARLAAEGLVSLARFKTNLDYEREIRRRAIGKPEVPARFAVRRREFEDAWYGQIRPDESSLRGWMAEFGGRAP
jgi:hypothetical protein